MRKAMSHDDANGRNSGSTFLIGFIAGSMLGAGLALLFAPRPGDETRREVAERAQRVRDKARDGLGSASDRVAHFAERGKAMYQTAAEKAREAAQAVREGRDPAIAANVDESLS
jgi:gas vesicle protein